jgi:hypothetical protein
MAEGGDGSFVVKIDGIAQALTFVRCGYVRPAEWDECLFFAENLGTLPALLSSLCAL